MRILVDLNQAQIEALNSLARKADEPRAQMIRRAVDSYLAAHREPISAYFGLWADNPQTQDVQGFCRPTPGRMGALRFLFDSDILIRALNGSSTARARELLMDPVALQVSVITWMEVLTGATAETEGRTRRFLARFLVCDITVEIAERAISIRKSSKLKLPDAIIYPTALVTNRTLVTYNTRDYPAARKM